MKEIKLSNIEKIFMAEDGTLKVQMKQRSFKFETIVRECTGQNGLSFCQDTNAYKKSKLSNANYNTFQFNENSILKTMLFGRIHMICDYANTDEELVHYHTITKSGVFKGDVGTGYPLFKSKELAEKAYIQNKALFDDFFSL